MITQQTIERRSAAAAIVATLLAISRAAFAAGPECPVGEVTADGLLDCEAVLLMDISPKNGVPDVLEGRTGFAQFQLDDRKDGTFGCGPDGFRDAGLRAPDIPREDDCPAGTQCGDKEFGEMSIRSSVNTGRLTVIYLPDADGFIDANDVENTDDSLLYVGMDIYNGAPRRVPAEDATGIPDVDYHDLDFTDTPVVGDVCEDGTPDFDGDGEADYIGVPFDVDGDGDPQGIGRWEGLDPGCEPAELLTDTAPESYIMLLHLCSDMTLLAAEGPLPRSLGDDVVEIILEVKRGETTIELTVNFYGRGSQVEWISTFPDPTDPLYDDVTEVAALNPARDIEFLIRHVDSIVDLKFPETDYEDDRLRLASGGVSTFSDSNGDSAAEDRIIAEWFVELPQIEVTKHVRCEGDVEWQTSVEALPGSTVEFKIEVENSGNIPLHARLCDTLEPLGEATATVVQAPLTATLFRPGDGAGIPINYGNAAENGLNPDFFAVGPDGFLAGVAAGECRDLGELQPTDACQDPIVHGDRIELIFKVEVGASEGFCDELGGEEDVRNAITAIGDPDIPPVDDGDEVDDEDSLMDTPPEAGQGFDDNVATVDLLCSMASCEKQVCADLNDDGDCEDADDLSYSDDLALRCDMNYPFSLIYRLELTNEGETELENAKICDLELLQDATNAGFVVVSCELDSVTGCKDCGTLAVDGTCTATCRIRVPAPANWDSFAVSDDDSDADCYSNSADASGTASTSGVCSPDGSVVADTDCAAKVCFRPCEISVTKGFRCVKSCADHTPVGDLMDTLPATPGATVEFEIAVTSEQEAGDEDICALRFEDTLTGPFDPCGPSPPFCGVGLLPAGGGAPVGCTVPGDWFKTDGSPFELNIWQACGRLMASGDQIVIKCAGEIPEDASTDDEVVNTVDVWCATDDGANCVDGAVFCAGAESDSAEVDIQVCDFDVTKQVKCADDPDTAYADEMEGLPGSEAVFRIQVCNTGEANITELEINDTLSGECQEADAITADLAGADATACICLDGACDTLSEINGTKDLTLCDPDGLAPGECLTITFKVEIDDTENRDAECLNEVKVDASTSVCGPDGACGGEQEADAKITVEVPSITCDRKEVCADLNNDGDCDDPDELPFTSELSMPCDVDLPFTLIYEIEVTNDGETPLVNVEICDQELVQDATAAGLTIVSCDLDSATGCKSCGAVGVGGNCVARCRIEVTAAADPLPVRAKWLDFAGRDLDGNADCYSNEASGQGDVEPGTICDSGAETHFETDDDCTANVCLAPPCEISVTKGFRCVKSCADRTAEGDLMDSLPATPGATVEFEIGVTNDSAEVPVCALQFTDMLTGPVDPCGPVPPFCSVEIDPAGAGGPSACGVPADWFKTDGTPFELDLQQACGRLLNPGDRLIARCAGTIPGDAAGEITNDVTVEGASDCPAAAGPVYCCNDSADANVQIKRCDFAVTKQVKCADDPDTAYADEMQALPGSEAVFRIQVCNTGEANISELIITDTLSGECQEADAITADIDGADATPCICADGSCDTLSEINGTKDLTKCDPDGLAPGECLTITFKVKIDDTENQDAECLNQVKVDASTSVCGPDDACGGEQEAEAKIIVEVPAIDCDKQACASLNDDGDCIDPGEYDYLENLSLPCDMPFPFWLIHRVKVDNSGETVLLNVEACDPPNGCKPCGSGTLNPGESCEVTWSIEVPDRAAWEALAGGDHCYENIATVTADVDTATICDAGADSDVDTDCSASACLSPPCEIAVTKDFRCVESCLDRTPIGGLEDSLEALAGATVEFEIGVDNVSSDVPVCALRFTDLLTGPFDPCGPLPPFCFVEFYAASADGPPIPCPVPGDWFKTDGTPFELDLEQACGMQMDPDDRLVIRCAGTIPDGASGEITNDVTVEGAPVCPAAGPVYCCDESADANVQIKQCDFTVNKQVKCADDPDTAYAGEIAALPGTEARFRIEVCNTGEVPISDVEIADTMGAPLDCSGWFKSNSVVCTIDGDDVTTCVCPPGGCANIGHLNGTKNLTPCRPGGVGIGECLTCTFDVVVPDPVTPTARCVNEVKVASFTEVCSPADGCGAKGPVQAIIDVQVPDIECRKDACADFDEDGACDTPFLPILSIAPDQVVYPFSLVYRLTGTNKGETPLNNVTICDAELLQDAVASGLLIVVCDLDATGCADCGRLLPGETCTKTCRISVNDSSNWETFAALDGEPSGPDAAECYLNNSSIVGDVDTDGLCAVGAVLNVVSSCFAKVCIDYTPCVRPPCFPVTKANFDIWNENEVKFSGVHRCIHSWDQTWLSRYDDDALVNQFWLPMMHTNKGKARINNHASTTVCGPDTIKAPLIGVAAKELFFDGGYERAGTALVGAGRGVGQILYDTIGPPPDDLHQDEEAPAATPSRVSAKLPKGRAQARSIVGAGPRSGENDLVDDRTRRASVSVKGSLLVFPLIEILWNTGGEVIQDTFLDLTNDGVDDVMVKLYFVDGDGCVWANNVVTLTANEASYWSALTGEPAGASPFTVLPSRCLYTDSQGQRVRRLRGYILAFAVDPTTGEEIRWNHLKGDALILNYRDGTAWEYNAWAFQAAAADVAEGDLLLPPLGQLDLDGIEYDTPPDQLILDFYASGATLKSGLMNGVSVDTELILWVVNKDLRQDSQVP